MSDRSFRIITDRCSGHIPDTTHTGSAFPVWIALGSPETLMSVKAGQVHGAPSRPEESAAGASPVAPLLAASRGTDRPGLRPMGFQGSPPPRQGDPIRVTKLA
jgi:hypothetical protein